MIGSLKYFCIVFALLLPWQSFNDTPPAADLPAERSAALYPKDYFQRPVGADIKLTGTFGELRSGHFHAGIDINSSTGGTGEPVYAAAAGFIDRIKVGPSGYGRALYVKHPNGYTTVYGHLERFSSAIDAYVKEMQYKKQRFSVDLNPPDGLFKVKQGEEIAKLGNSGSSSGPHLHFEIRRSASGKLVNPLLFGIPVSDNKAPEIRDMKIYYLNENREVMGSRALSVKRQKDGALGLEGDTMRIGAWRIGFGVKAYDSMTGFKNDNGVYGISLYVDDVLAFGWKMDELDYDESRYLNAHVDYTAQIRYGAWFHRCFVLPGDRLSNYAATAALGAVPIYAEKAVKITLKVTDAGANTSALQFWVLRDEANMESFVGEPYQYALPIDQENRIELNDFYLVMPKGALYERLSMQYTSTPSAGEGIYSAVHQVHHSSTPVHRYYEIGIRTAGLPEALRTKAVIAKIGSGRPENCGVNWNADWLSTRVREFGRYCVMVDTEAPSITPIVFDRDMRKKSTMSFRIRDNFGIDGMADGLYYRGTVDGQWVLFEYDKKSNRLIYKFDEHVSAGEHQLKLVVKDDRDNAAVFERSFIR